MHRTRVHVHTFSNRCTHLFVLVFNLKDLLPLVHQLVLLCLHFLPVPDCIRSS